MCKKHSGDSIHHVTAAHEVGWHDGYREGKAKVDELEALFELQHTRTVEATALWRKAHPGNDMVLPDLGKLVGWLLEEREAEISLRDTLRIISFIVAGLARVPVHNKKWVEEMRYIERLADEALAE